MAWAGVHAPQPSLPHVEPPAVLDFRCTLSVGLSSAHSHISVRLYVRVLPQALCMSAAGPRAAISWCWPSIWMTWRSRSLCRQCAMARSTRTAPPLPLQKPICRVVCCGRHSGHTTAAETPQAASMNHRSPDPLTAHAAPLDKVGVPRSMILHGFLSCSLLFGGKRERGILLPFPPGKVWQNLFPVIFRGVAQSFSGGVVPDKILPVHNPMFSPAVRQSARKARGVQCASGVVLSLRPQSARGSLVTGSMEALENQFFRCTALLLLTPPSGCCVSDRVFRCAQ